MGAEKKKEHKEEKDLDRMTVKELKAVAAEIAGLVGIHSMKKADLLAAIKEAKGVEGTMAPKEKIEKGAITVKEAKGIEEKKAPKEKIEKEAITVKQLKTEITELKKKRQEARKAKDKRIVHILRRKINRLKKETRKISQA